MKAKYKSVCVSQIISYLSRDVKKYVCQRPLNFVIMSIPTIIEANSGHIPNILEFGRRDLASSGQRMCDRTFMGAPS